MKRKYSKIRMRQTYWSTRSILSAPPPNFLLSSPIVCFHFHSKTHKSPHIYISINHIALPLPPLHHSILRTILLANVYFDNHQTMFVYPTAFFRQLQYCLVCLWCAHSSRSESVPCSMVHLTTSRLYRKIFRQTVLITKSFVCLSVFYYIFSSINPCDAT